jgi:hypothetical protein
MQYIFPTMTQSLNISQRKPTQYQRTSKTNTQKSHPSHCFRHFIFGTTQLSDTHKDDVRLRQLRLQRSDRAIDRVARLLQQHCDRLTGDQ